MARQGSLHWSALVCAATLAIGSGACGSTKVTSPVLETPASNQIGETGAPSPAESDACSLIVIAELEQATGKKFDDGVASNDSGTCTWTSLDPPTDPSLVDQPMTFTVATAMATDTDIADLQKMASDPDNEVVEAIGEVAVIENSVLPGPMFLVVHENYLLIDFGNFTMPGDFGSDDDLFAAFKMLARSAVARL